MDDQLKVRFGLRLLDVLMQPTPNHVDETHIT